MLSQRVLIRAKNPTKLTVWLLGLFEFNAIFCGSFHAFYLFQLGLMLMTPKVHFQIELTYAINVANIAKEIPWLWIEGLGALGSCASVV